MWTKENYMTNDNGKEIMQGVGLFKIEEVVPRSSFDSTELDDDCISQPHQQQSQQQTQLQQTQCKTTKYNEQNSIIFTLEKSIDEDSNKTPPMIYRCNSSGPSFHSNNKSISQEPNEYLHPRTNESAKTLLNYLPKQHTTHDNCIYSQEEHDTFSSILSYYNSTKEYLAKELSSNNDISYSDYNYVKRQRQPHQQDFYHFYPNDLSLAAASASSYYSPQLNSSMNYPKTNSGPSCFLYMKMAQMNYAKYMQSYYSKMRDYIAMNNTINVTHKDSTSKKEENDHEENSKMDPVNDHSPSRQQMFGKNGWICDQCTNFNYETRCACNRCGNKIIVKDENNDGNANSNSNVNMTPNMNINTTRRYYTQPREKNKVHKKLNERKGDWICFKCRNLNFAFRTECNRCQMAKTSF